MNSKAREYGNSQSRIFSSSVNHGTSHSGHVQYSTSYGDAYAARRPRSARLSRSHPSQTYDEYGSQTCRSQMFGAQAQAQEHIFRSAQASKQMVYDVYANTITMLEELETRELMEQGSSSLARSDIYLPSQRAHDKATIERKIDTQLLLLQSQLESCDKEILGDVTEDLKVKTLDWTSQRQAHKINQSKADVYTGKLLEVLVKRKTKHPEEFYKKPSLSERGMQQTMGAYMHGQELRYTLDESFKHDPSKRAVAPKIRAGAGRALGVERMIEVRPDMEKDLRHYMPYDNK